MPDPLNVEARAWSADLAGILDAVPCGILSFTDEGTLTVANATLHQMLGHEPNTLPGRHVETLLTVASRIFYQTHFFPLLRLQERADEIFLVLRARDGTEIGALVNARRRERDGIPSNDCALVQVRERRKFEEELLRARRAADDARATVEAREHELAAAHEALLARTGEMERQRAIAEEASHAKGDFLTTMSHELRTPLNAIGGYVELLRLGIYGPVSTEQQRALDRVVQSQRHLLGLINDVLNLARIESRQVHYAHDAVPLAELAQGALAMLEPLLVAKSLTYEVSVDDQHRALADREKLRQVLVNLLSNAVKFTGAGGRVIVDSLTREEAPARVFLRVRDTGMGIAPDRLTSVFEPFVQIDSSHTRQHEGTGLGLAISRDLARAMGGDLTVTSALGRGSEFVIELPRAD